MQNSVFSSCLKQDNFHDNQTDISKQIPNSHSRLRRAATLPSNCRDPTDSTNTTNLSLTEQEIHSHPIIRTLLYNCRNKVVSHTINQISPHTQLYPRTALREIKDSEREPAKQAGLSGGRLRDGVYGEIANETPIWLKIKQSAASQSHRLIVKQKAASLPHRKMRNINVSGLTTYNFTSVKARFRIAYDPAGTDQELNSTMAVAKDKAQQAIKRAEKIERRTDPVLASNKQEINRAITESYPELNTTEYLQALHREKQNSKVIFGEKASHFDLMRQSMLSESDREQAEFLINAIKLASRPLPKHKRGGSFRRKLGSKPSEQQLLRGRRQAAGAKQVLVSYVQNE